VRGVLPATSDGQRDRPRHSGVAPHSNAAPRIHSHGTVHRAQIFDRQGQPLYYREFNRPLAASKDEHKLMYGFLFSLKKLVASLSPKKGGGFYACSTSAYKLHYFETASGLRFVMTTDLAMADMRDVLRYIYSNFYVECLVKNPLWRPGEPITCPNFTKSLERYVATL
jgi:hypothetical protein